MYVIHVSTAKVWRGGEQQILNLMRGLCDAGVSQAIVCRRGKPLGARLRAEGFDVLEWRTGGYLDWRSSIRLSREATRRGAEILHLHGANAHAIGVRAARLAKHHPKTVVARRVAYSIYRHSFFGLNYLKYTRGVDRILCVSQEVARVLRKDGVPERLLAVVNTGIDVAAIDAAEDHAPALRRELGIPDSARIVGTVGALTPEKGQRDLIEALSRVLPERPDVWALFVGSGPLRGELERAAQAAGIDDRVRFAGFRQDVPSLWRAFDVFCFPSHAEGFGSAVLEALAARRAVVATRVGGAPDAIEDRVGGRLVMPGDPAALASAIGDLLDDPVRAAAMGATGRARVEAAFTVKHTVAGTLAEYHRLIG